MQRGGSPGGQRQLREDRTMGDNNVHTGTCFCGAVELTVTGEPAAMGYCHCDSCRAWSAGPVNAFSLWPPDAVRITKGADNIGSYRSEEHTSELQSLMRISYAVFCLKKKKKQKKEYNTNRSIHIYKNIYRTHNT